MIEPTTATAADRSDSGDIVAKLKTRMIDHALPLWSTEGWDQTTGGFIDRLASGRPRRSSGAAAGVRAGPADLLLRQGGRRWAGTRKAARSR